jgi:hypothetical protein
MTIKTKPPTKEYDAGWERTFGKKCCCKQCHKDKGKCAGCEGKCDDCTEKAAEAEDEEVRGQ